MSAIQKPPLICTNTPLGSSNQGNENKTPWYKSQGLVSQESIISILMYEMQESN